MSVKLSNASPNRRSKSSKETSMPKIDLSAHIHKIKKDESWRKNDRNAITIFKTGDMSMILVAMHRNAGLVNHVAESVTSLHVLEGNLTFETDERSFELVPGNIVAVHEGVR